MSYLVDDVISAVASMSVAGITAKYNTDLKSSVETAFMPYRFITHRNAGASTGEYDRDTLNGPHYIASFRITDICLFRAVAQGINEGTISGAIYNYMNEYLAAVRSIATDKYMVVACDLESDLYEYPISSGKYYDTVIASVTIGLVN
jgi:hypothetical protein